MKANRRNQNIRLLIALGIVFTLGSLLILRLGFLQIVRGEELKRDALEQWTRNMIIKPKRGLIYDRNGKKLAVNTNASTLWLDTREVPEDQAEDLASVLADILDLDEEKLLSTITNNKNHQRIKQWISKEELQMLVDLRENTDLRLKGLSIEDDYRRFYPNENLAAYILGFTNSDNKGLYGIEERYDSYLKGREGNWVKTTDAPGRQLPFDDEKLFEVQDGHSLILTLDESIQKFAEDAAEKAMVEHEPTNVSIIVMEPKTGDILAMVNKPDYNPNKPREAKDEETKLRWETMTQEEVQNEWFDSWRNFAINDIYEPGSTFKVITAAAALEENKATENTGFYCAGPIKGTSLRCNKVHHNQSLVDGLNNSCNSVFVEVARRLGREDFNRYIKGFGFGEKTGIDLNGETEGIIYRSYEDIKDINLATMSYGHGIAITPIQLINSISASVNGGNLMRPRVVKEVVDSKGGLVESIRPEIRRKVISKSTSERILAMLESVVSDGTARNAFIEGYRVGGKTGTAEKVIDGRYSGKYIGSFVGVGPIEDPKITVLVIVDDPKGVYYGGTVAAPIAREVMEKTFSYYNIKPSIEVVQQTGQVEVPLVEGMTIGEAGKLLVDLGLRYSHEYSKLTPESIILKQSPAQGTILNRGDIVDIYFEYEEEKARLVPDLIGLGEDQVIELLKSLNIEYNINGEGSVTSQSLEPGQEYFDQVLEINLE